MPEANDTRKLDFERTEEERECGNLGMRPADYLVMFKGEEIGHLARSQFAKGWYLYLQGTAWQNAPGARFTADSGFASATYVKSTREAERRVITTLVEKGLYVK